jgi:hypothetical protein
MSLTDHRGYAESAVAISENSGTPDPTDRPSLTPRAAVRASADLPLARGHVAACLREGGDELFRCAWENGLGALRLDQRRGRLCVDTGFIAESVTTLLLGDVGLDVFAQIVTPGVHGVDLLALAPEGTVLALEVKGTLRAGSIPGFARGKLRQMSIEWLNDPSNPAMAEWGFEALDIYGGVAIIDFARDTWRVALTGGYKGFMPVLHPEQLLALSQLAVAGC